MLPIEIERIAKIKTVYIAGPFRGPDAWEIEQNIRRAETLALEVWRAGFGVLCPHTNTRFFQGAAPDAVWLDGDLALIRGCDAVLMTSDWRRSSGARTEREFAIAIRVPVFHALEDLCEWRDGTLRA